MIKILSVVLVRNLALNQHSQYIVGSIATHELCVISDLLSQDSVAATLAVSLVQFHLDYANSLLYGTSTANLNYSVDKMTYLILSFVTWNACQHVHC